MKRLSMNTDFQSQLEAAGATFTDEGNSLVVKSFGNDAEAIAAASSGAALYDRTHWDRIDVSDSDRIRFLHNQSTNDFERLSPGQGCETVFVTSTARTIDLVSAYVLDESVLLLTSPGLGDRLMKWMDRFIFFADKVKPTLITDQTATLSLIGPKSTEILATLVNDADHLSDLSQQPWGTHQEFTTQDISVRVAVGSGLATEGYTLIVGSDHRGKLWEAITSAEAVPMGETAWEYLRIAQGRPMPERELTDDYNPLEAGLWRTVSFEKGCYIGQETIARLDTYNGVKQQLWGIQLNATADPGTVIMDGDTKIGRLTSVISTEDGYLGLAYIRTKAGGEGMTVTVGEATGRVVDIPFVRRSRGSKSP
ncbi:MAG: folate-binding protein [Leptolyngbyaceae bacterium]|nr:folate-binding protein [Leptolyngbyaceae bacterium]